jgi:hypothetical protein
MIRTFLNMLSYGMRSVSYVQGCQKDKVILKKFLALIETSRSRRCSIPLFDTMQNMIA